MIKAIFICTSVEGRMKLTIATDDSSAHCWTFNYRNSDHLKEALAEARIPAQVLGEPKMACAITDDQVMTLFEWSAVSLPEEMWREIQRKIAN